LDVLYFEAFFWWEYDCAYCGFPISSLLIHAFQYLSPFMFESDFVFLILVVNDAGFGEELGEGNDFLSGNVKLLRELFEAVP